MPRSFIDTNVLVYADDEDSGPKRDHALLLLEEHVRLGTAVFSTQVLQEFFVIATKKLGIPAATVRRKVELLGTQDIVPIDVEMILGAIDLHRLHSLSFWDALILRAAKVGGCTRLLTEDLQHGQIIDGVRIENPFAE